MPAARIRRLTLTNFRSYHAAQIDVGADLVVLIGPNGAGKTNLIEAISFLAPGRGLRRATLDEVAFAEGDGSWAVAAEVEGALGLATLGTGIEPPADGRRRATAQCRIDREPVSSATAFADHLRVVWLMPAMDQLFDGPGLRAPPLPRPAGARGRCRAHAAASTRSNARCARATGCWRSRAPIRTGSTRSSTRPPSSRSRSRRCGPRRCDRLQAALAARRDAGLGLPGRRDRARRLDGEARAAPSGGRGRGPLPRGAQGQPRARRRRRPHARRAAPHRPRR